MRKFVLPVVVFEIVVVAAVVVVIDAVRKIVMRKLPYSQNILLIIGQIEKNWYLISKVTRVPDITEQALAVKDFHYLSRMKPFLRFYLHRQKNANGSKFGLFL